MIVLSDPVIKYSVYPKGMVVHDSMNRGWHMWYRKTIDCTQMQEKWRREGGGGKGLG